MKRIVSISTGVLLLFSILSMSTGCEKIDKLTQFHINFTDTVTLPSMIGINLPFNIATPAISTNSSEVFEINDTRKDLIEEIKIEELNLNIIEPEKADFSFLNSIEIFIISDNHPEALIAWKYDIDDSPGKSLSLELTPDDLTIYVIEDEINLKISTTTDKIIASEIKIEIQAGFFVNAKILGI
jgi:hypothetical protein